MLEVPDLVVQVYLSMAKFKLGWQSKQTSLVEDTSHLLQPDILQAKQVFET